MRREELQDIKELCKLRRKKQGRLKKPKRRKDFGDESESNENDDDSESEKSADDSDDSKGGDDESSVDEERLYELELFERHRNGEELAGEELKDWETFNEKRRVERPDKMELADLTDKVSWGQPVDEVRLHCLKLLDKKRRGDPLTEEEIEVVRAFECDRRREKREELELQNMIAQKARGKPIDEDRFYKLRVYEKKRNGESLNKKEKEDFELFEVSRKIEDMEVDLNATERERLEEEQLEEERVYKQLLEQGLPNRLQFRDGEHLEDMSSFGASLAFGNDSFLRDLQHQQETRTELRKEEALEDAFEIYQAALRQKNLAEDEELFKEIFQKVLREKNQQNAEADRLQDERIQQESRIHTRQKWKNNPRQALRDWVGG